MAYTPSASVLLDNDHQAYASMLSSGAGALTLAPSHDNSGGAASLLVVGLPTPPGVTPAAPMPAPASTLALTPAQAQYAAGWAAEFIRRGWRAIPIPFREKGPRITGWKELRIGLDVFWQYWPAGAPLNVGVVLGDASGGLVDVDLDCVEALQLADQFLPPTGSQFGRDTKPRSHRLYRVTPGTCGVTDRHQWHGQKGTIVEYRANDRNGGGVQTVFPGSVHPSGEAVRWDYDAEPVLVDAATLRDAVARLAEACRAMRGDIPAPAPSASAGRSPVPAASASAPASASAIQRCKAYLENVPPAIEHRGGRKATRHACCIVAEFGLAGEEAVEAIREWNERCVPPWNIDGGDGLRGYLEWAAEHVEEKGQTGSLLVALPGTPKGLHTPGWIVEEYHDKRGWAILDAIARRCHHTLDRVGSIGHATIGYREMEEACGVPYGTCRRIVNDLLDYGYLSLTERGHGAFAGRPAHANKYAIPGCRGALPARPTPQRKVASRNQATEYGPSGVRTHPQGTCRCAA